MKGKLYLIPSSLSENVRPELFNPITLDIIKETKVFIVEKVKTSRRFIKALIKEKDIDECTFFELNKHSIEQDKEQFLQPATEGNDIALISEAGCPGIADPGAFICRLAHKKGIKTVPIPGPSSIYMALMASGLNGQHFEFHGYLNKERNERKRQLKEMETKSKKSKAAQIFMETPFRNQHIFDDVIHSCNSDTLFCIARNISESDELILTKTIREWKNAKIDLNKRPCIFILGQEG